jgi:hypothetical protein
MSLITLPKIPLLANVRTAGSRAFLAATSINKYFPHNPEHNNCLDREYAFFDNYSRQR